MGTDPTCRTVPGFSTPIRSQSYLPDLVALIPSPRPRPDKASSPRSPHHVCPCPELRSSRIVTPEYDTRPNLDPSVNRQGNHKMARSSILYSRKLPPPALNRTAPYRSNT